jgi:hypothetical protein
VVAARLHVNANRPYTASSRNGEWYMDLSDDYLTAIDEHNAERDRFNEVCLAFIAGRISLEAFRDARQRRKEANEKMCEALDREHNRINA